MYVCMLPLLRFPRQIWNLKHSTHTIETKFYFFNNEIRTELTKFVGYGSWLRYVKVKIPILGYVPQVDATSYRNY